MAETALEEKINKIKLQNEEIKRRHEEVEADKKNAAKINALVQMVPSSDWPERKEPPEFSSPSVRPSAVAQPKSKPTAKENYYTAGTEGKTMHKFADGDGPPPDPKYNFLADSERENDGTANDSFSPSVKDDDEKRQRTKKDQGVWRMKRGGNNSSAKQDYHLSQAPPRKEAPEYEAWRAERNRIDEARINRQKTAEGNWRREWDNNKIIEENKRDAKDYEKRYHHDSEHSNYNRSNDSGFNRSFRGNRTRDAHGPNNFHQQNYSRPHQNQHVLGNSNKGPTDMNKTRTISSRGIGAPKGPVMSVRVNSSSIAGTGRVGPRQKARVTYSAVSERDAPFYSDDQPKFFDDKHKAPPISPYSQRKDQSFKNGPPKNDRQLKKDFKMTPRPQRQLSDYQPSRSGLESRLERVRSETQVQLDEMQVVGTVDGSLNEIQVVSEPEQFHLNDENRVSEEVSLSLEDLSVGEAVVVEVRKEDQVVSKNQPEEEIQNVEKVEGKDCALIGVEINEIESSEMKDPIDSSLDSNFEKAQTVDNEMDKIVDVVKSEELMVVNEDDSKNENVVESSEIREDNVKSEELVVVNEDDSKNEKVVESSEIGEDNVKSEELMVVNEDDSKIEKDEGKVKVESSSEKENEKIEVGEELNETEKNSVIENTE